MRVIRCVLAGGVSLENCNAILSILEEAVDLQLQEEQGEDRDETDIPLVVFTPGIADETVGAVLRDGVAISRRQVRKNEPAPLCTTSSIEFVLQPLLSIKHIK